MFKIHETIKANKNMSSIIKKGCKGTIVFVYKEPNLPLAYEVEFFDKNNNTLDILTVKPSDIVKRD
jgi:hypothetical protein